MVPQIVGLLSISPCPAVVICIWLAVSIWERAIWFSSSKAGEKLRRADALVVEADISGNETPFSNLPKCPPLVERLSAGQLSALEKRVSELGMPLIHFDNQPLWQIAMVLQATQAQRLGLRPDYGIDYQLLQAAREMSLPVQELEGAKHQLELLCDLPDGGMALLDDTLTHWHTNARLLQVMIGWWLEQPPTSVGASLPRTFSQPLYDVLMVKRNEAARRAAGTAAGTLRGSRRGATSVRRRQPTANIEIKNGQYRYWPVKEEFHRYYYPDAFASDLQIVAQSCRNCQDLMHKIILFLVRFRAYADGKSRL